MAWNEGGICETPTGHCVEPDRVDLVRLAQWARTTDDVPARAIQETDEGLAYGLWLTGFNKSLRQFQADTGVRLQRDNITLMTADGRM